MAAEGGSGRELQLLCPRPRLRHDAKQLVIGQEIKSPERIQQSQSKLA